MASLRYVHQDAATALLVKENETAYTSSRMQLCAGCVRTKNVANILYLNTMDCLIVGVTFYCFGYGLAFGSGEDGSGNAFIGSGDFFLGSTHETGAWHIFFFHYAVVAAVTTIAAGAMAEQCRVVGYAAYAVWMSTFVYPVVAHWYAYLAPVHLSHGRNVA
jgi:ammonium transporter, Amt family